MITLRHIQKRCAGIIKVTNGTRIAGYCEGGFPQIIATEGQISLAGDRIEVRGSKHREDSMRPLW